MGRPHKYSVRIVDSFYDIEALSRTSIFRLVFLYVKFPMEIVRQRNIRKFSILDAESLGAVEILMYRT